MPTPDSVAVYQLRIRLDRISPMIWRQLLVTSDTTIADLHACIQIAFGWSDSHLHRFVICGKSYGISYPGGMSFADNPGQVRLADFRFRTSERFFYEYNFHVPWCHEIRIEQIGASAPGHHYPVCVGGARIAPPEECGSPHAFLTLRQRYHPLHVIERLLAPLGHPDDYDDPYEELRTLQYWAAVNRCDCRAINWQLCQNHMLTSRSEAR